ncbi:MAG: LuxR C-terminal-related transcriptional regulator [Gordonia sp. (in: high G+C Gram-positive bacteria)]|uniref:LuxR C-terminal-related transcriptional regulator n=1 Tax=Gordonia sp. (in: high G+C Gram-positive bacteria) TaxID=84139 RepID=UPI0039E54610
MAESVLPTDAVLAGVSEPRSPHARDRGPNECDAATAGLVREILVDAAAAWGDDPSAIVVGADHQTVRGQLSRLWSRAVEALGDAPDPGRAAVLAALLARIREVEQHIADLRVSHGVRVVRDLRSAFARLQRSSSVEELFSATVSEMTGLDFDRCMISTVEDRIWHVYDMHIPQDPHMAAEFVAIGHEDPPLLDDRLIESDVVVRGEALVVSDVQHHPRVNRAMTAMSGCDSYVIAPFSARGRTVGILHADSYFRRRTMTAADREVLGLFAVGLGQMFERVSVMEGLGELTRGLTGLVDGPVVPVPRTPGPERAEPVPRPAEPRLESPLSARETEVIELMCAGESNRGIARRLFISEGTVKTHVSHVLRKLEVSNRAEAVAYWIRLRGGEVDSPARACLR